MKWVLATLMLLTLPLATAAEPGSPIEIAVANPDRSADDRKRDETSKPAAVLDFFGVEPGMRVLDLLSGGGYYSEILSHIVGPDGEVVAHTNDIYEEYSRDEIKERYRGGRLPGVRRLYSNFPDLKLGSETFDRVLMVMTYHDLYYVSDSDPKHPKIDRDHFFAQIHRSLKPGGILAIVDHAAKPGTGNTAAQELHRIDEAFARADIEAAGFVFERGSDTLRNADDDRTLEVFDERIRRRTDRFVHRYVKARVPE